MPARAYVVHRIPGRLRLRIPDRRQDQDFFQEVASVLEGLPDPIEARMNPSTGSLLLLHPSSSFDALETRLQDNGVFELVHEPPPASGALAPLIAGVSRIDRAVSNVTAGSADLRTLLFIAAVALTVRQIRRGELFGPALPMMWAAVQLASSIAASKKDGTETDGEHPLRDGDAHP